MPHGFDGEEINVLMDEHERYKILEVRGGFVAICTCGWRSDRCSSAGVAGAVWDGHVEDNKRTG